MSINQHATSKVREDGFSHALSVRESGTVMKSCICAGRACIGVGVMFVEGKFLSLLLFLIILLLSLNIYAYSLGR